MENGIQTGNDQQRNGEHLQLRRDIAEVSKRIQDLHLRVSKLETYILIAIAIFNLILGPVLKSIIDILISK